MWSEIWRVVRRDLSLRVLRELVFLWLANHLPRLHTADALRALLLRLAGMRVRYPAHIWAPLDVRPIGGAARISIGKDTFINSYVRLAARAPATIQIGERVLIGPGCYFETVNHTLMVDENGRRGTQPRSIVVEDEVWFGARVTVLPGVRIGKGSVIAAGAVVTEDVAPYTVVGGIPARPIRRVEAA